MLVLLTVAAGAGWLFLFALLMAVPWGRSQVDRTSPPEGAARGAESPAVVSLLAARLDAVGYPATLLDLVARGWLRLEARPRGPMMCVIAPEPPGEDLTVYERRVYDQVVSRAGTRGNVPAAALSDGFAGPATLGTSERDMRSATDSFMAEFRDQVKADSRRRGLSRQRLSEGAGCLLWLAATGPTVLAGFALRAAGQHTYWIPVAGGIALWVVAGIATKGEKLTRAGRAALGRWRARCAGSGGAALAAAGGVTPLIPAGWPDRLVAYAAALGQAGGAVKLFAAPTDAPEGRTVWSSYTGSWRQITIGEPPVRGWRATGGTLLSIGGLIMLGLFPATLAVAVLSSGVVRVAALAVMVADAVVALRYLDSRGRIPRSAEFDGRVVEAWIAEATGENGTGYFPKIAIDDGQRDQAWVFTVSREQYAAFTPGTHVHAWVNPRRNELTRIEPAGTG
jgi:hypothetical protein